MANGAEVTFIGNMTRDPELKYGGTSGKAWCTFGIAVNKVGKDNSGEKTEKVTFFNCKCFGDFAENIAASLSKGTRVSISGTLEQEEWKDDKGDKRTAMVIFVTSAGPDLRWATAKVERTSNNNSGAPRASAPVADAAGEATPFNLNDEPF